MGEFINSHILVRPRPTGGTFLFIDMFDLRGGVIFFVQFVNDYKHFLSCHWEPLFFVGILVDYVRILVHSNWNVMLAMSNGMPEFPSGCDQMLFTTSNLIWSS